MATDCTSETGLTYTYCNINYAERVIAFELFHRATIQVAHSLWDKKYA